MGKILENGNLKTLGIVVSILVFVASLILQFVNMQANAQASLASKDYINLSSTILDVKTDLEESKKDRVSLHGELEESKKDRARLHSEGDSLRLCIFYELQTLNNSIKDIKKEMGIK